MASPSDALLEKFLRVNVTVYTGFTAALLVTTVEEVIPPIFIRECEIVALAVTTIVYLVVALPLVVAVGVVV